MGQIGAAAERDEVVTTAADVGRAGGMKALPLVVVVVGLEGGGGEEDEVEVVDVVIVVWDVEISGVMLAAVIGGKEEVDELEGGGAVTEGFTMTVVVDVRTPVGKKD